METWMKVTLFLCFYGVLKEIRPAESFVTNYLHTMGFSLKEINEQLYPISVYSTLCSLIIVFLVTDLLRYTPVIAINSCVGLTIYVMLITLTSLTAIKMVEVLYGIFIASEVAYYAYIYANVSKSNYQKVTGYTRAAVLTGRSISGFTAQLFVSLRYSYYFLNCVTLGGQCLSLAWALLLPPASSSIYFNRPNADVEIKSDALKSPETHSPDGNKFKIGFYHLWQDFKAAFKSAYVLKWAFWSAMATCGYLQIILFIQILWESILKDVDEYNRWNGAVDFGFTLLSALAAYGCGYLKLDWGKLGELVLLLISWVMGAIILVISQTEKMSVAYIGYIGQAVVYNAGITIANSEIAKNITADSCGLVFGIIIFIALCIQTVLTLIVINVFQMNAADQFAVYGGLYLVLGLVYAIILLIKCFCGSKAKPGEPSSPLRMNPK